MWISRKFYEDLAVARTEASTLKAQNAVLQANLDWARFRISQVEKERAQLLYVASGAKIAVPEFVQDPAASASGNFLNDLPSMEDMGDELATRFGLSWDKDGKVVYGEPKVPTANE